MLARIVAMEIERHSDVTIEQLLTSLSDRRDQEILFYEMQRLVFLEDDGDGIWHGLFATVKDQFRYAELKKEGASFKLAVKRTDGSILDYNYFTIRKKSDDKFTLMYLQYSGAPRVTTFKHFLHREYRALCTAERDQLLANPELKPKEIKAIRSRYWRGLSGEQVVTEAQMAEILARYTEIREFSFIARKPLGSAFTAPDPKKVNQAKYAFGLKPQPQQPLHQAILNRMTTKKTVIKKAKVRGKLEDNIERTLSLFSNPNVFEEYELDKVTEQLSTEGIADSFPCKAMRTLALSHPLLA
ncbi:MAG: hypothetical protein KDB07_08685 [Planctomycetes bacterium]|nr:hypothetical protein [Planctomycetota bacterium]